MEECDIFLVQNIVDEYNRIKVELFQNSSQFSLDLLLGDIISGVKVNEDIGKNWKWLGIDFVKSFFVEFWVIYLNFLIGNLFLCLMYVFGKV